MSGTFLVVCFISILLLASKSTWCHVTLSSWFNPKDGVFLNPILLGLDMHITDYCKWYSADYAEFHTRMLIRLQDMELTPEEQALLTGLVIIDADAGIRKQESRVIIDASKEFLLEALLMQFQKNHEPPDICRLFSMLVDLKTLAHRSIREDKQWIFDHKDLNFPDPMYDILGIPLSRHSHRNFQHYEQLGSDTWRKMFTQPEKFGDK